MAQNQFGQMHPANDMQYNYLRDYDTAPDVETLHESLPQFPEQTPPGMAYVPFQQWEEPYDIDTAFLIGTIFPALDFPFREGGSYA